MSEFTTELIVALDVPAFDDAVRILDQTASRITWYKIGYEAYYGFGQRIIQTLRERGKKIFLDLKLHDIPNTAAGGIRSLAWAGASLLSLHAAGGRQMLLAAAAARDEAKSSGSDLRLLAVTVLTSQTGDQLRDIGFAKSTEELVAVRAALAADCGMDGVVCAVEEVAIVRARTFPEFLIVCPGIRPAGQSADDQQRVATPTDAVLAGAVAIVVGRPITLAADPAGAVQSILDEIDAALPIRREIEPG